MSNFKERLVNEIEDLENKIEKLSNFIEKYDFDNVVETELQKKLLVIQLSQMNSLLNILKLRLEDLGGEIVAKRKIVKIIFKDNESVFIKNVSDQEIIKALIEKGWQDFSDGQRVNFDGVESAMRVR